MQGREMMGAWAGAAGQAAPTSSRAACTPNTGPRCQHRLLALAVVMQPAPPQLMYTEPPALVTASFCRQRGCCTGGESSRSSSTHLRRITALKGTFMITSPGLKSLVATIPRRQVGHSRPTLKPFCGSGSEVSADTRRRRWAAAAGGSRRAAATAVTKCSASAGLARDEQHACIVQTN